MGFHKVEEGKRYLYKELDQILHALQSGKAKLTAQSASALANIIQGLEMTKLFEDIREVGGLKHVLETLTGGSSHGGHRQIGFHTPYHSGGMTPKRWQPQMDRYEMEAARRRYRRPRYDGMDMEAENAEMRYDMDADGRYDLDADMDADFEMEMARRYRRYPRRYTVRRHTRRMPRYDMDVADDLRDDIHHALETAMRYARTVGETTNRADTTHNRYDGQPHGEARADTNPTHRAR